MEQLIVMDHFDQEIVEVVLLSKARRFLSVALSLVLLLTIVGCQKAVASKVTVNEHDTNLLASNELLIKTSEVVKEIEIKSPEGKVEVKKALVSEYVPVNSSAYLLATGQDPLEQEIVKVVDVTYLDEPNR
ncbi:hypothetical protein P5G61_18905 [Paenibacillus sp. F6_3S_P_1C]|uniref:Uncharacterized protein n=1 Tax=Paenibacillus vandeheii TaxID=3035917 RepID=A0ABT8JFD4_9BACL|nr:hypothetical protein [Paenibacillus vandeheii]MDN4603316.1 hypothetical protein [Paenibacillus vandeheii]